MLRKLLTLTVCFVASMFVAQAQDFHPQEFLNGLIPDNHDELIIYLDDVECKGGKFINKPVRAKITIDRYLTTITCDYLDKEFYVDAYIDYWYADDMEQVTLGCMDSNDETAVVRVCRWINGPLQYISFEDESGSWIAFHAADDNQAIYHTMQAGDCISHLAVKYNTTSKKIQELNPDVDPRKIEIGQKIRVK